jgi:hypothetical protein
MKFMHGDAVAGRRLARSPNALLVQYARDMHKFGRAIMLAGGPPEFPAAAIRCGASANL